jgi:predicted phage gp36 major capsid-like protein
MTQTLETKSASDDVSAAFEDFARAFVAFKETNDERLGQIETRLSADPLTEEKVARIDQALDDARRRLDRLTLDRARPPMSGDAPRDPALSEQRRPSGPTCAPARPRG